MMKNNRYNPRAKRSLHSTSHNVGKITAAVGLALEIILPSLAQWYGPDRICKFLQQEADFQRLEFRCHQSGFAKDFSVSRDNIPISMNALSIIFDSPRFRVMSALAHWSDRLGHRGNNIALDDDRERQILD
jgi:hypothetical protein